MWVIVEKGGKIMDNIVAEYTIREVAEDGKCKVQYIVGDEVLLEGKEYPHNKFGHPYFCQMVSDSLDKIKEG